VENLGFNFISELFSYMILFIGDFYQDTVLIFVLRE